MNTIYKYPILIEYEQKIMMPVGAKILCVQIQHGEVCLWALVDPDKSVMLRTIEIFGTGHPIDEAEREYIGTVQQTGGMLIWHVFEKL